MEQAILIDASASLDPDQQPGAIQFEWGCSVQDQAGAPCSKQDGTPLDLQAMALGNGSLVVPANTFSAGSQAHITCSCSKGARSTTARAVTLTLESGQSPSVIIHPLSQPRVNANQKLVLEATVISVAAGDVELEWSDVSGRTNLTDTDTVSSPAGFRTLVLLPLSLETGSTYVFQLTAQHESGTVGFAQVTVVTNEPPSVSEAA